MDNLNSGTNRLGIELLSTYGMPPLDFVPLVGSLGCRNLSIGLTGLPMIDCGYPAWSLRDDGDLRRDFVAALKDHGVQISQAEGFLVRAGSNVADLAGDLDLLAEMGALAIGTAGMEPDAARALDEFALLAQMAGDRGLAVHLEFVPGLSVSDLPSALAIIEQVGLPHFRVMLDTMHFFRSGGTIAQLVAVDPARIGYVQLCDVPLVATQDAYMTEAMTARCLPGEGELPLAELIRALPQDIPIGLEVPNLAATKQDGWQQSRLRQAVAAARAVGA
jgi:sugar phosphate isomerase/epimerase